MENRSIKARKLEKTKTVEGGQSCNNGAGGDGDSESKSKQEILQDLTDHLAVHAERMKLLSRAEEGLVSESFSPYSGYKSGLDEGSERKENIPRETPSKIPVPKSRQRKKDAETGMLDLMKTTTLQIHPPIGNESVYSDKPKSKKNMSKSKKSGVQIKNYRADYTWNRGGRLKELRIRHLARKFSSIWKSKVFGRVLPSAARRHYEHRLLKAVFEEWHLMWWEVRKEWRLMVRAECHHRYVVWNKFFQAWRMYVLYQKATAEKMEVAKNIGDKALMLKTYNYWKQYIEIRRQKKKERLFAKTHYFKALQRSIWLKWKEKYNQRQEFQDMEVVALQFWAYRIQAQHWLLWIEKLKKRRQSYHKHAMAARHYQQITKHKCFFAWAQYWLQRRDRKRQKEYADLLHAKSLKYRMFNVWKRRYDIHQSIKAHHHHIQILAQRFQLRRHFQNWKFYVEIQAWNIERQEIADIHYAKKLMLMGFSAFHLNVVQARVKRMRKELAEEHYYKSLLSQHWSKWLSHCDDNEELQLIHLTRKAYSHYTIVIKRKCWQALIDYTKWREQRKMQIAQADAHFFIHSLPKFLFRWRIFVEMEKIKRENQEKSITFRRENLLARFFYHWFNSYEQTRDFRMNFRMAVLHNEDRVRRRFWCLWRLKTHLSIEEKKKLSYAEQHFNVTLCRKHLSAWRNLIKDTRHMEDCEVKAATHHYRTVLRKTLQTWREYIHELKEERLKMQRAMRFYERVVCRKVLNSWKSLRLQGKRFHQVADKLYHAKCVQHKRWAFNTWRENVLVNISSRHKEQNAMIHHNRNLLHKIIMTWHRYAAIHAYKKSETRQWVECTRQVLCRNKLARYFWRWHLARDEAIRLNFKREQAISHHNRVVLQKAILEWRQFTQNSQRKNLLMKQGVWFHNIRVMSNAFCKWKMMYQQSEEENQKTDLALWHWSLVLQKKILVIWYGYTADRKRKKDRISAALERRRKHLIRQGVTKWLSVATDLSCMRSKIAAQQHAKDAFVKHQLIERCALHWRHITAKRRMNKGGNYAPVKKTSFVGFEKKTLDYLPKLKNQMDSLSKTENTSDSSGKQVLHGPQMSLSPARTVQQGTRTDDDFLSARLPGRRKPRHPSFLAESLKRAGLFVPTNVQETDRSMPNVQSLEREEMQMVDDRLPKDNTDLQLQLVNFDNDSLEPQTLVSSGGHQDDVSKNLLQSETVHQSLDSHEMLGKTYSFANSNLQSSLPFQQEPHTRVHFKTDDTSIPKVPKESENEGIKLLTPDDFLLVNPCNAPAWHLPIGLNVQGASPLSTPRTVDSASLAISSMIRTIDSTSGIRCEKVQEKESLSLSDQIVQIRNKLKVFENQKKKLRKLQKQHKQLTAWLVDVEGKVTDSEREEVKLEVQEMELEITKLQQSVESKKPECTRLVTEVNNLIKLYSQEASS